MKAISHFINSPTMNNAWLRAGYVNVYVRKGVHFIEGEIRHTFDVANIEVDQEHRGCGHFKKFLSDLNDLLLAQDQLEYIYVEGILENRLLTYLPSEGFNLIEGSIPPSFYRNLK